MKTTPQTSDLQSTPPSAVTPEIDQAIDTYITTTYRRFERVMTTQIPTLPEPRVTIDDERALKRLRFLIETLTGVVIGVTVGQVASAIRRKATEPVRAAITEQLARMARSAAPPAATGIHPIPRFLEDSERALLDRFGSHLHVQLFQSIPVCRTHLATIAQVARDHLDELTKILMANDDLPALTFADHIALGWQHYTASLTTPPSAIPDDGVRTRTRDTWRTWTRRLTGRAPVRDRTRDEVLAAGYLMCI